MLSMRSRLLSFVRLVNVYCMSRSITYAGLLNFKHLLYLYLYVEIYCWSGKKKRGEREREEGCFNSSMFFCFFFIERILLFHSIRTQPPHASIFIRIGANHHLLCKKTSVGNPRSLKWYLLLVNLHTSSLLTTQSMINTDGFDKTMSVQSPTTFTRLFAEAFARCSVNSRAPLHQSPELFKTPKSLPHLLSLSQSIPLQKKKADGDYNSCQSLSNLCVLQLYSAPSEACRAYKAIATSQSSIAMTNSSLSSVYTDVPQSMPWLYYGLLDSTNYSPQRIAYQIPGVNVNTSVNWSELGGLSNAKLYTQANISLLFLSLLQLANTTLNFVMGVHTVDGVFLGLQKLNTELQVY